MDQQVDAKVMRLLTDDLKELAAISQALENSNPTIAWPNIKFKPLPDVPYLAVMHLKVPTQQPGLSPAGHKRYRGIYQVSVFWPHSEGSMKAAALGGDIIDYYPRGKRLSDAYGLTVEIGPGAPALETVVQEDAWINQPCSIPWFVLV